MQVTFSAATTTIRRPRISWSDNLEKRTRAHRLWIGSMILDEVLQASPKRVELEYISIVLLKACWAPEVMLIFIQYGKSDITIWTRWGQEKQGSCTKWIAKGSIEFPLKRENSPVSFIQNYYLVSTRGQCNFLLGKHLYFVSHNINSSGIIQ